MSGIAGRSAGASPSTESPADVSLGLLMARGPGPRPAKVLSSQGLLDPPALTEASMHRLPPAGGYLDAPGGDPGDLTLQRWGLVVPEDPARREELLSWCAPLRALRELQQRAPARVYSVPPGMDGPQSVQWLRDVFRPSARERELPRYLLILGDLHEVSLELQQVLAGDRFVGRLAFDRERDWRAYVEKVLSWEVRLRPLLPKALFFCAHDGSEATRWGYPRLIQHAVSECLEQLAHRELPASVVQELSTPSQWSRDVLLAQVCEQHPSVLLSLSHGLGPPADRSWSPAEQRAHQGALCLGNELLGADVLSSRPFLPGGLWLPVACFGAGTPATSLFRHWLVRALEEVGSYVPPERVVPVIGDMPERPFVSGPVKAALANGDGPLAVLGHVDLAWTNSFQDERGRSEARAFTSAMRSFIAGERFGIGANVLARSAISLALDILRHQDADERERAGGQRAPAWRLRRGLLWMTYCDLSAYILVGDPAARLSVPARRD
ncbi:hypothetical protein LZ198_13565 [Myxococcus sp. K15C18031901]|uniref:hypothetical protein n=1 Tax=Myxococcus dinghuensis TaxID=2906761 RepID=UPI0020A774B8|nr:hypothetical protein [Myxococcus dinghuensis]MCP3099898.1 hypothetical protein [Myxococcus dinghuensis]